MKKAFGFLRVLCASVVQSWFFSTLLDQVNDLNFRQVLGPPLGDKTAVAVVGCGLGTK